MLQLVLVSNLAYSCTISITLSPGAVPSAAWPQTNGVHLSVFSMSSACLQLVQHVYSMSPETDMNVISVYISDICDPVWGHHESP